MCTLIAIHRAVPGRWLVVAANRDEYFDRPALGPAVRRGPGGAFVSPLDAHAGGTWLGLNEHGVFAALTNLRDGEPDPTRKSRGMIVLDALELRSADAAAGALARLPRAAYNAFNCLVADRDAAYLITHRERTFVHRLEPGVHVVGNADAAEALQAADPATATPRDLDPRAADRRRKVERVRSRALAAAMLPPADVLDSLGRLCSEHGQGATGLDDTCVHVADTYGTRSSLLLELADAREARSDEGRAASRLLYADAAPCRAPYQDFSSLLTELSDTPATVSAETFARTVS